MRKRLVVGMLTLVLVLGATPAPTVAQESADVETTRTVDDGDDDSGKWGLAGLLGLVGLMGLKRRDDRDYVKRTDTR